MLRKKICIYIYIYNQSTIIRRTRFPYEKKQYVTLVLYIYISGKAYIIYIY